MDGAAQELIMVPAEGCLRGIPTLKTARNQDTAIRADPHHTEIKAFVVERAEADAILDD